MSVFDQGGAWGVDVPEQPYESDELDSYSSNGPFQED